MVSLLASFAVDRGFEHRSGKTKDYKIGNCWFFPKHTTLGIRAKTDWNHDNVSKLSGVYTHELLFQSDSTINTNY